MLGDSPPQTGLKILGALSFQIHARQIPEQKICYSWMSTDQNGMKNGLRTCVSGLDSWWQQHSNRVLIISTCGLSLIAVIWLGYEFFRMIAEPEQLFGRLIQEGSIDLKHRHSEVSRWFRGVPIYDIDRHAIYPPASYVLFYPLFGWSSVGVTKAVWIISAVVALCYLVFCCARHSLAQGGVEKVFMAIMPLSMYAAGATIGNGQVSIHVVALLVGGCLCLTRGDQSLVHDMLGVLMVLFALAKPSIAVPFFWIILFYNNRLRPGVIIVAAYLALTLYSASFQEVDFDVLVTTWLKLSSAIATEYGQSNIHILLTLAGLEDWLLPASLILLLALGLWVYLNRSSDIWILLGVTAIIARIWTYHAWYDDLLLLVPLIALFRVIKQPSVSREVRTMTGCLFTAHLLFLTAPGGLYLLPKPYNFLYSSVQIIIWIGILIFLGCFATRRAASKPLRN